MSFAQTLAPRRLAVILGVVTGLSLPADVSALAPGYPAPEVSSNERASSWVPQLPERSGLDPVPRPNLESTDDSVRVALTQARARLEKVLADPSAEDAVLAESYGETGLLYQAHLIFDSAATCFKNAERLAPSDYRWPYYRGYLEQQQGRLSEAADHYKQAMQLNPGVPWIGLRSGLIDLRLGRFKEAEQYFEAVATLPDYAAAARLGLGRVALEQGDYARALEQLKEALRLAPEADEIHYPLAMAYRGLGNTERAIAHLARRGQREPAFPDPLIDVLPGLSVGQRMLFHLGLNAMYRDDFAEAGRAFRQGLEIDADNYHARISLARILFLSGDPHAAELELRRVLESHPEETLALVLMGVLRNDAGDNAAAARYLRRALENGPRTPDLHFLLADTLARTGDFAAAAEHYGEATDGDCRNRAACRGEVLALARAGVGHLQLAERILALREVTPADPLLSRLQIGLLAASPDPNVRDGEEAVRQALRLRPGEAADDSTEWLAMALAEKGDFSGAMVAQEQALRTAMRRGPANVIPHLLAQLDAYRDSRPWRQPWTELDLIANWPWIQARSVFRDFPSQTPF